MEKRLPLDSYEYYISLGDDRSYRAVAEHFGVAKQTVTNRAVKEQWQDRIARLEKESHARADEKFLDTMDEAKRLHFKAFRAVLAKGVEAIKQLPLSTAMEGVRAIEIAFKNERILRGEPSEHQAVSVEEILRQEVRDWVVPAGQENDGWDELEDGSISDPALD